MSGGYLSKVVFALAVGLSLPAYAAAADHDVDAQGAFKAAGCYIETPEGIVMAINRGWDSGKPTLQFPVGSRRGEESPQETVRREVSEELGVEQDDITIGRFIENINTEKYPVYLFSCTLKDVDRVTSLTPKDQGESLGSVIINPDKMTYESGAKKGQAVDIPFRFAEDSERAPRLFPQPLQP